MARPLTAPSPLDTLEEAFDLLQRASASVWFRYLAGSGPLIVGLLFVLNEFSGAGAAAHNPVVAAGFLVVLLVWFYRCRQSFSGHLRRTLAATRVTHAPASAWSLACFEGTKLIAIPLAVISLLPMAYAVAFYRSLTLFAAEGLSPRDAAGKAWKASIAWQRENWFVLAILDLFGIAVLVDIAVTVIIAPILVKIFTGYESIFTQRGAAALTVQFPLIAALTWLCFDPLLQAVYVVRAFEWEGLRTGEDLLVRLKRLAPVVLLLGVTCFSVRAAQPPTLTRDNLNQSIDQTLQSHDYDWRMPPVSDGAEKRDWFIDTVDRIVSLMQKGWKAISDLWSDLLDWLDRLLRNAMPSMEKVQSGQTKAVRPIFYIIGLAVIALTLVLLWKFGPRRKLAVIVPPAVASAVDLNNEGLLASDLPEDEWLRMAERYASSGDPRLALRALYLGTLALLHHQGLVTIHACKSNRDYEGEVRRRSRDTGLSQIFRVNVRSFEQAWYGFHEVTGDQLQRFRENLGRMRSYAG